MPIYALGKPGEPPRAFSESTDPELAIAAAPLEEGEIRASITTEQRFDTAFVMPQEA